ncbi:MAG: hypothetical protein IKZ06_00475 [Oscillospiraceae bacterium]|nr:hypothetical protein [Oscillospiraceae bacterium]
MPAAMLPEEFRDNLKIIKQKTDSHFLVTIRFYLPLFPWFWWWSRPVTTQLHGKSDMDLLPRTGAKSGIATKSINNIFLIFSAQPTEILQNIAILKVFFGHFRGLKLHFTGVERAQKNDPFPCKWKYVSSHRSPFSRLFWLLPSAPFLPPLLPAFYFLSK